MKFFRYDIYDKNISEKRTIEFPVLNCNDNLLSEIHLAFSKYPLIKLSTQPQYKKGKNYYINLNFYCLKEIDELKINQDLCGESIFTTDLYKCKCTVAAGTKERRLMGLMGVSLGYELTTAKCSDYQMKRIHGELVYRAFFLLELLLSNDNFSNNFIRYIGKFLNEKFLFNGALGFYLCRKQYLSNIDMSINLIEEKLPFFHFNDHGVLRTSIIKEQSENLLKFVNENYLKINNFSRVAAALRKISEYMIYNMCSLSFTFFPVEVFSDLAQKSYTLGVYPPTNTDENTILLSYENNNYLKKRYPEKSKYNDTLSFLCLYFSLGSFSNLITREDFDFNFDFLCRVIWGFANARCGKKINVDSVPKFVTDRLNKDIRHNMLKDKKSPRITYRILKTYICRITEFIQSEILMRNFNEDLRPARTSALFKMPILQSEYYDKEAPFQRRKHVDFNCFHNQSNTSRPHPKMDNPYPFYMTTPNEPMEISKKKVNIRRNECVEHIQPLFFSNENNNNNALSHERRSRHNNNNGNYLNTNPFARSSSRFQKFSNSRSQNNNFGSLYIEEIMNNNFTINLHNRMEKKNLIPKQPCNNSNNTPKSSLVPRPPNF